MNSPQWPFDFSGLFSGSANLPSFNASNPFQFGGIGQQSPDFSQDASSMMTAWLTQSQEWFANATNAAAFPNPASAAIPGVDAQALAQLQQEYAQRFAQLNQQAQDKSLPAPADRRFTSKAWTSQPTALWQAHLYLLNSEFLKRMSALLQLPAHQKLQLDFGVDQLIASMSPANFLATNPEALEAAMQSQGQTLTSGLQNLLKDIEQGRVTQNDDSAFEVGCNVATTQGSVVFENELFQLIHYKPLAAKMGATPLVMVPPCINKFYILDLQPTNSLVRYALEQGANVFLVSWNNPGAEQAHLTWDDYVEQGAIKALQTAQAISGSEQVNAFGFCVGGTIVSTAVAVLHARKQRIVRSLTLLTTLLDFSDVGILNVFVDEAQVQHREMTIGNGGLMPGRDLHAAFTSLRPNDLLWNYVVANYLKGQQPPAFDLLYWNGDSTNLPGPMFCWYLRNTYLEDRLKKKDATSVNGTPVDLSLIDIPVFIYGSREDHIVPWHAAYKSIDVLAKTPGAQERITFVLGASGHIAGVINPASANKRSHWVSKTANARRTSKTKADVYPADPDDWFSSAQEHPGSWWPVWGQWLQQHLGPQVKAPISLGSKQYKPIEAAPGRYVKTRA